MTLKSNIYGLYIFTFFTYFYLWMPIWVIFLQEKGLSLTSIGILDAVVFFGIALLEIPSGAIADRFGRKYALAFGSFIYSMGMLFLAISESISIIVIGYFLWHISNTFFSGTNMAFLYDSLKYINREKEYQKIAGRLRAITSIALSSGSVIGAWIAGYSMKTVFFILFVICLLNTFIALCLVEHKNKQLQQDPNRKFIDVLSFSFKFVGKKPIVRNLIFLSSFISSVPFIVIYVMVQPYAQEKQIPVEILGFIFVLIQVLGMAGSLTSNKLKDVVNEKHQFTFIPIFMIFCLSLIPLSISYIGILAFGVLSFMVSAFSLLINTKINTLINSSERATILSFSSMISAFFVFICEPVMLMIYDKMTFLISILFSTVIMLFTTVPLGIYVRHQLYGSKLSSEIAPEETKSEGK
ncbi:MFS transporter [Bacillus haynesii]|uniref:MFS transporter n=1 Tax=Bacillus haynesii TaxID=1925021 RepID=UPI0022831B48|nr:MFS transporter [Bacillus haynesii]MCY9373255.1 MFS transporter [Bacillus haynesii]